MIAPIAIAGLFAYIINPAWTRWSAVPMPTWLRRVGVGLGGMAGILLIVVFRMLGTNLTDTVVTRVNHTLVTSGPYRWVRHPFYVAFALAVTANAVVAANWFLGPTATPKLPSIGTNTSTCVTCHTCVHWGRSSLQS